MRKVILAVGASLDMYIAREDGAVDWLTMDWDFDWMEFFKTIDVVLMGRKTLEKAVEISPDKKSNPYKGTVTYVFSRNLRESEIEGVELITGHLKDFVENLKSKAGKNIWLCGGGELAKSFLNEDLVDEIHIGITPILLGEGIPLFPDLEREVNLRLISNKTHKHKKEDNGMVELKYEVKR
jgi:dihydrofolate reductase